MYSCLEESKSISFGGEGVMLAFVGGYKYLWPNLQDPLLVKKNIFNPTFHPSPSTPKTN